MTDAKCALLTVNIGDWLAENSRASFQAAAQRWGCQYVEITEAPAGLHPWATKLRAFQLTDADRVLYLDADMLVRADCPSPFVIWPEDVFVAALNQQDHMPPDSMHACADTFERDIKAISERYGDAHCNRHKFFNSGMWLASRRSHALLLQMAEDVSVAMFGVTSWRDQTALNYALSRLNTRVIQAPDSFNFQFPPDTGDAEPMKAFVYHYAGNEKRERIPGVDWRLTPEGGGEYVVEELQEAPGYQVYQAQRPRLLWIGDAVAHTGFARVTHNILEYLRDRWEVHLCGLNYQGDPHNFGYPIYPACNGGDIWGVGRFGTMLSRIKPEAVVILNDPWIITKFMDAMPEDHPPVAAYMPVDARNIPEPVCQRLNRLDLAICYTEFGLAELRRGGFEGRAVVIPHGIDIETYRPVGKTEALKAQGLDKILPPDNYIVGNVNRNQPRKRLDLTIEYFAEWVHKYRLPDNVYLYLHCAQRDSGWDLPELAHYYGVDRRMILPDVSVVTPAVGIPEAEMPYIYGSFDVQVTTTMGEGWGLTQAEGMACGIPQIVPCYSSLAEWCAGAALMVQCRSRYTHIMINTIGGVPDKDEFIRAMHLMYTQPEVRAKYGQVALERVREQRFRWIEVAGRFEKELATLGRLRREQKRASVINVSRPKSQEEVPVA